MLNQEPEIKPNQEEEQEKPVFASGVSKSGKYVPVTTHLQQWKWKPGQSGNPNGAPKADAVANKLISGFLEAKERIPIEKLGVLADHVMQHILLNEKVSDGVKVRAATTIWEREGHVGTGRNQSHSHQISFSPETMAFIEANRAPNRSLIGTVETGEIIKAEPVESKAYKGRKGKAIGTRSKPSPTSDPLPDSSERS